jgi:hypothetical protein
MVTTPAGESACKGDVHDGAAAATSAARIVQRAMDFSVMMSFELGRLRRRVGRCARQ